MTDLEISKALALAIGYQITDVAEGPDKVRVYFGLSEYSFHVWREFDYRDWNVIGPIAQRYDCFPAWEQHTKQWFAFTGMCLYEFGDTPQKAIALAVIEGAKK